MATSKKSSKSTEKNGSSGSSASDSVGATASEAVDQVQDTVTGLKDQVKEQASTQLTSRLETAAGGLETVAKLLRTAGDQVKDQDKAGIAGSITGFADRLEGWSSTLREQDVDKLVQEARTLAQSRPGVFVAGATALGFLGARFLTTSAKKQEEAASSTSESGSSSSSTDSTPATSTAGGEFDNTNPYPSAEENAALEASIEAPIEYDELVVVDDVTLESDVLLDDTMLEADVLLDDPILGTDLPGSPRDARGASKRPEDR